MANYVTNYWEMFYLNVLVNAGKESTHYCIGLFEEETSANTKYEYGADQRLQRLRKGRTDEVMQYCAISSFAF